MEVCDDGGSRVFNLDGGRWGFNLVYIEHQVACEHSADTAVEFLAVFSFSFLEKGCVFCGHARTWSFGGALIGSEMGWCRSQKWCHAARYCKQETFDGWGLNPYFTVCTNLHHFYLFFFLMIICK